ncbi:MAG: hypothetical protein ABIX01_09715 [Chitinophagaceae bacterium]
MNTKLTKTQVSTTTPSTTDKKMSTARSLMIGALATDFWSLFLPYVDNHSDGDIPILWNTGNIVHFQNEVAEKTGFQLLPYAGYVVAGLIILFISNYSIKPFWQRYGYWISLILLLVFAFGGAVIRTTGGILSLFCMALVIIAIYLNSRDRRQQKATVQKV